MWQLKKAYYRAFQKIMKIAMYAFDWSEPELLEGPGAIDRLPALIESKGLKRVLIVTDQGLMSLHILDGLLPLLKGTELNTLFMTELSPTPQSTISRTHVSFILTITARALSLSAAAHRWTAQRPRLQELPTRSSPLSR